MATTIKTPTRTVTIRMMTTQERMVHISRAGQRGADYVPVEIDATEQCFVCPDCGERIARDCANGHQALSIDECFADVF